MNDIYIYIYIYIYMNVYMKAFLVASITENMFRGVPLTKYVPRSPFNQICSEESP